MAVRDNFNSQGRRDAIREYRTTVTFDPTELESIEAAFNTLIGNKATLLIKKA